MLVLKWTLNQNMYQACLLKNWHLPQIHLSKISTPINEIILAFPTAQHLNMILIPFKKLKYENTMNIFVQNLMTTQYCLCWTMHSLMVFVKNLCLPSIVINYEVSSVRSKKIFSKIELSLLTCWYCIGNDENMFIYIYKNKKLANAIS